MARKLKNALVHGVYSSDLILPWEKAEDFIELLNGLRRDFQPIGMSEDLAIFDKACAYWKKFRMQRVNQVALHQNAIAAQIEESGKRGVNGIRSHLDRVRSKKKRRHEELATAASELAEAADLLAQAAKSNSGLGKVGANMRYVVGLLEKVQPIIAEAGKADKNDGGEFADFGLFLDTMAKGIELDARLSRQIDKATQQFVMAREVRRQYGAKSTVKLLPAPGSQSTAVANVKTKSVEDNDWENNNDNNCLDDESDPDNPLSYDRPDEYDKALKSNPRLRKNSKKPLR